MKEFEKRNIEIISNTKNKVLNLAIKTRDEFESLYKTKVSGNCEAAATFFLFNLINNQELSGLFDTAFILRSYAEKKGKRFVIPGWEFDSGAILLKNNNYYGVFFGHDREKDINNSNSLENLFNLINCQTPGPWPNPESIESLISKTIKPKNDFMIDSSANKNNDIWDYDDSLDKKISLIKYSIIISKNNKNILENRYQSIPLS